MTPQEILAGMLRRTKAVAAKLKAAREAAEKVTNAAATATVKPQQQYVYCCKIGMGRSGYGRSHGARKPR